MGLIALLLACAAGAAVAIEPPPRFAAMYGDPSVFERSLAKESVEPADSRRVTGITVPAHLVAADLIARGFRCASGGSYERIILLSPDHFRRSRLPFATTRGTFETVFGEVACDESAVDSLLAACPKVAESALFSKEHGFHAVLPFVARFFPKARIVPVALRVDSKREDWLVLVDALALLVDSKTLVIQSTDFSHLEGVIVTSLSDARRVKHALVMEKEFTLGWLKALKTRPEQTENHVEGGRVRDLLLERFREIEWLVFPEIRVEDHAAGELRIQPRDGLTRNPALVSHISGTAHEKRYSRELRIVAVFIHSQEPATPLVAL